MEMEELKFSCPKCSGQRLEEVTKGVTVYHQINTIHYSEETGIALDYSEDDGEDGYVHSFQCMACGYTLEDKDGFVIKDYNALVKWLRHPTDYLETV